MPSSNAKGFRTIKEAALATGRPERTIRTWERLGLVRSASNLRTRKLLVHLVDVARLAETAQTRTRRAA